MRIEGKPGNLEQRKTVVVFAPGHLLFRHIIENWQKMREILEMLFCRSDDLRQIQFPSVIFIGPSDKVTFVLHVSTKNGNKKTR